MKKRKRKRKHITFVEWLTDMRRQACSDAVKWVKGECRGRLDVAWKRCTRPGWMVWLIQKASLSKLRGWSRKSMYNTQVYRRVNNSFQYKVSGKRSKILADQLRKHFTPPRWNGGK